MYASLLHQCEGGGEGALESFHWRVAEVASEHKLNEDKHCPPNSQRVNDAEPAYMVSAFFVACVLEMFLNLWRLIKKVVETQQIHQVVLNF